MVYDNADKVIVRLNKRNLRRFDKLKLAAWDELNLVKSIKKTYKQAQDDAIREYIELGVMAYMDAMILAGVSRARAESIARRNIDRGWVLEYLAETDPVTMYQFMTETERKAQRLTEAVEIEQARQVEIERALRSWSRQTGQYAISIVDRAMIDGFAKAGVKKVRWNTERDERVCEVCEELDGQVFSVYNVPPKQHYNCRCWLTPVK